jgi:hypothetical protein
MNDSTKEERRRDFNELKVAETNFANEFKFRA